MASERSSTRTPEQALSERVAEEIRAWMGRRRMTGATLSSKLGVSPAWVSYRLSGRQEIGLNDLQRIADALDVAAVNLLPRDVRRAGEDNGDYARLDDRVIANGPVGGPLEGGDRLVRPTSSTHPRRLLQPPRSIPPMLSV